MLVMMQPKKRKERSEARAISREEALAVYPVVELKASNTANVHMSC